MTLPIWSTETLLPAAARAALAAETDLGAGNFLRYALAANPAAKSPVILIEKPFRSYWGETFETFSLRTLQDAADRYAAWYASKGVRAMDPVAVYLADGVDYLVHYLALVGLGAIPVLTNGHMPPEIAVGHFKRVGAVGVFSDTAHKAAMAPFLGELGDGNGAFGFVATGDDIRGASPGPLPASYPHRHSEGDPIMIAHSSGTTGIPKAVLLQHKKFFHGVRYRLGMPPVPGGERILSSLPHSHNCAIAYIMLALLAGTPVYVASDHTGEGVLRQIERFRPTMVVSFPQTYVEMCELDLDLYDLSSVNLWFNGGDAAHEAHIRKLVRRGSHMDGGELRSGSRFIDGMGSSEMGFSLFRHVHTPATAHFGRCVGTPLEWVEAAVFGDDGRKLGTHSVGRLGVKAPSVTTGYWNDSALTFRTQIDGFWLTGDLAYRDEAGRFYHVDRVPDAIRTAAGPLYSLQTEELLMKHFPDILDCSVVGAPDGAGASAALACVRWRSGGERHPEAALAAFNAVLREQGLVELAAVESADDADIPLGSTGKVLKRELRELYKGYFTA
jgi:acyl-coenzyme A synthetase/AMP-(fatty) acid ligase